MTPDAALGWWEVAKQIGVPLAMLLILLLGLYRGVLVLGTTHAAFCARLQLEIDALQVDRDFWRGTALDLLQITHRSTKVAETAQRTLTAWDSAPVKGRPARRRPQMGPSDDGTG